MGSLPDYRVTAAAHQAIVEETSDVLVKPQAHRRGARYDAYKRPLLVAAVIATGVGMLASLHGFDDPKPRVEIDRGRHASLRPPSPQGLATEARATAGPAAAPLARPAPESVNFSDRLHVPLPQLEYRPVPESAEQLSAPFVQIGASEASHAPRGDPGASVVKVSGDVYTIDVAGDGAIDPGLGDHDDTAGPAQQATSVRQDTSPGPGESAGGLIPAGFLSVSGLTPTPAFEQPSSGPSSSSGTGGAPTPAGMADRVATNNEIMRSAESPVQAGAEDLTRASLNDGKRAGEEPQLHNDVPVTLQAIEAYDAVEQTMDDRSAAIEDAKAANEAPSAPHIAPNSVSARSVEYSIPMQIQGVDAGDVQLMVENDRVSISLASLLNLVKPRMDAAEFAKLNSSTNARAYISTEDLQKAGFVVGFDPTKASLIMSTK
jgi:hypothetical protein